MVEGRLRRLERKGVVGPGQRVFVQVKQGFPQDLPTFSSKRAEALDGLARLHLFEQLDDGAEVLHQVPQEIEGGIGAQPPETLSHALQFIDGRVDEGEGSSRPFADWPARIGRKHEHRAGEHEQVVQHLPVGLHQVQSVLLARDEHR